MSQIKNFKGNCLDMRLKIYLSTTGLENTVRTMVQLDKMKPEFQGGV